MYDDSWYSFIPNQISTELFDSTHEDSNHDLKESASKQPDDKTCKAESIKSISEIDSKPRAFISCPNVTPIKRSKSYSNFFEAKKLLHHEGTYLSRRSSYVDLSSSTGFSYSSYESFEDDLVEQNLEEYKLYHDHLEMFERHLDKLLVDTNSTLDYLATLSESFRSIDRDTTAFKGKCEDLLADQKRLIILTREIGNALQS
ncbi:hypothetical protein HI914_06859 [Erysiphe necator]|uniref:Putative sec34-like family protein n=1 Tax=Uncinula necator TaxID=52586 RepID=A0A0B1P9D3_UNCNE|nr:hypothetical protein HI914_06859 [Erysiphe necator]KHJ34838.1 putative sec34-like family protein [Erysiphe necator]